MSHTELVEALDRFEARCRDLGVALKPKDRTLTRQEVAVLLRDKCQMNRPELEILFSRWNGLELIGLNDYFDFVGVVRFDDLRLSIWTANKLMSGDVDSEHWSPPLFPVFCADGLLFAYCLRVDCDSDPVLYQTGQGGEPYPLPAFPSLAAAFSFFTEAMVFDRSDDEDAVDKAHALGRRMFPDMPNWFDPPYPPVSSFLPPKEDG